MAVLPACESDPAEGMSDSQEDSTTQSSTETDLSSDQSSESTSTDTQGSTSSSGESSTSTSTDSTSTTGTQTDTTTGTQTDTTTGTQTDTTTSTQTETTTGTQTDTTTSTQTDTTTATGSDWTTSTESETTPTDDPVDAGGGELQEIVSGERRIVDIFARNDSAWIVYSDGIERRSLTGELEDSWDSPRELTTAVWWNQGIVVADLARIVVLDQDFASQELSDLIESCADSVVTANRYFICGPAYDWDRVFYTFDLTTGAQTAGSRKYTYNGTPMRKIPMRPDFVTVTTALSPSDYHLYSTDTVGKAIYRGESPYHGDFAVNNVYGFKGRPATHVINPLGIMLNIYTDACLQGTNTPNGGCFEKDGVLGTLFDNERFVGMTNSQSGDLYALVSASDTKIKVQRIDIDARLIKSERLVDFTDFVLSVDLDPTNGAFLALVQSGSSYRVLKLPYRD